MLVVVKTENYKGAVTLMGVFGPFKNDIEAEYWIASKLDNDYMLYSKQYLSTPEYS